MKVHRSWILILMLALALPAAAQSGSKTVAVVNGENITEDDLNKAAAADLQNLELKRMQAEATYNRDKSDIMKEFTSRALNLAQIEGARYADIRIVNSRHQMAGVKDGHVDGIGDQDSQGFGVRVLVGNSWL